MTPATGTAERDAALAMLGRQRGRHRATLGADKAYDAAGLVADLRALQVTPHVAQNTANRRSAIDARTTRHPGYAVSQRVRKRIEESFGWIKTVGGLRKARHRGSARVGWMFTLTAAACNLVRLPKLLRRADHAESARAPGVASDDGSELSGTPAEASFHTSGNGNEAAYNLISAAC